MAVRLRLGQQSGTSCASTAVSLTLQYTGQWPCRVGERGLTPLGLADNAL
jgi:hypothetical protein